MAEKKARVVPKREDAGLVPGKLVHLGDLDDDFMVADPYPDIRDWKVALPDGTKVGKVDDLLVDTTDMSVKYIEVKVDAKALDADEDEWVLVPVGTAHLADDDDIVVVDRLPVRGLTGAPRLGRVVPTDEQEREIHRYFEPAARGGEKRQREGREGLFDQRRFWGKRRAGRKESPYLARRRGGQELPAERSPVLEELVVEEVVVDGVVVERRVLLGDRPVERGRAPRDAEEKSQPSRAPEGERRSRGDPEARP